MRLMMGGLLALALVVGATTTAHADYMPVGPQNDVAVATVTGGGWTEIYRGDYGEGFVTLDDMFGDAGEWIMLAGYRKGSDTFDVLAAVKTADFLQHTALNVTKSVNGSEWYYNGYSLGFAGAGDVITQNSADNNGQNERDRLSWHTSGGHANLPTSVNGGWRSGTNTWLNSSTDWERVVFTKGQAVPEPGSLALLGLGLGGLVVWRRRRK